MVGRLIKDAVDAGQKKIKNRVEAAQKRSFGMQIPDETITTQKMRVLLLNYPFERSP